MLSDKDILKEIRDSNILVDPIDDKSSIQPSSIDLRLSHYIRIFKSIHNNQIDILNPIRDYSELIDLNSQNNSFILNPGEFILSSTLETIRISNSISARLEGKSSLGRIGIVVHSTAGFIDPGFSGTVTLELTNISKYSIKLYSNMYIAQICFFYLHSPSLHSYGDKVYRSKYNNQYYPTESKI